MYIFHMSDSQNKEAAAPSLKIVLVRMAQLAAQLRQSEEQQAKGLRELQVRLGELASRIRRQEELELKIEEVIEKHNSVVRSFELRLAELKRLVEEQELQLLRSAEEIRRLSRTPPRREPPMTV